jgi:hypothetical protein
MATWMLTDFQSCLLHQVMMNPQSMGLPTQWVLISHNNLVCLKAMMREEHASSNEAFVLEVKNN